MPLKNYCTVPNIENYILKSIGSAFEPQVEEWMEAVEEYIDNETGRNFVADTTANAKFFDGDNSRSILIDDAVEITEIKIGDNAALVADSDPLLADGEFLLYPANKLPITKIVLRGGIFPAAPLRCVKITGKWGYSVAAPALIKLAATVLTAGILNYSLNGTGKIQSKTIGRYSVSYKTEKEWQDFERIDGILKSYKKFTF